MRHLLIILAATFLLGQSRPEQQTAAQSPKRHAANNQSAQSQTKKPANNQIAPDTSTPSETQFYTYYNQEPQGDEIAKEISDGLLVAFTFALGVVGYLQWRVLCKHEEWMQRHDANLEKLAQSAKDNAEAARKSLENTMKADRARLVADAEPLPLPYAGGSLRVNCRITNVGRTLAWLTTKATRTELLDSDERLPAIEELVWKENEVTRWPDKGALFSVNGAIISFLYLTNAEAAQVYQGTKTLWVYGFAEYRDTFGANHGLRYCFRYVPQSGGIDPTICRFYVDGPAAYNQEIDIEKPTAETS